MASPTGYLLKHNSAVALWLTELFRVCFLEGVLPAAWKQGVVVAIPKKGGAVSDPGDYRRITLESVFLKCYELVLMKRLQEWAEGAGVLHDSQYGFRRKRGTQDAIMHVLGTADCRRYCKRGDGEEPRRTWVAFLDIRKAYDTVQHPVLLAMLWKAGVVGRMWKAIHAMYDGATRQMRVQNELSPPWEVVAGVMQGPCGVQPSAVLSVHQRAGGAAGTRGGGGCDSGWQEDPPGDVR